MKTKKFGSKQAFRSQYFVVGACAVAASVMQVGPVSRTRAVAARLPQHTETLDQENATSPPPSNESTKYDSAADDDKICLLDGNRL